MRVELDTKNKTISFLEDVSVEDLVDFLNGFDDPSEWKIKKTVTEEVSIPWTPLPVNPYPEPLPWQPYNPQPWTQPIIYDAPFKTDNPNITCTAYVMGFDPYNNGGGLVSQIKNVHARVQNGH